MIEPKEETIDGIKFYFNPLPARLALKLDKQVITLITPALGGLKDFDLKKYIDLKAIVEGIGEALRSLDGDDFIKLVLDLLCKTATCPEGEGPQLIDGDIFDKVFSGNNKTVYKLMFAVMKYNKFLPFELGLGGSVMKKILSLNEKTKKVTPSGKKLEK